MSLRNIYGEFSHKKNCDFQFLKALMETFVLVCILVKLRAPSKRRIDDELDYRDYSRILMKFPVNFDISFQLFSEYLFENLWASTKKKALKRN